MAIVIGLIFLVCAALMYTKRLPALLALPLMALAIAFVADPVEPLKNLEMVFGDGSKRLAGAMSNAIFGAMLAYVVAATGIGENLVKRASELAGDRPIPVSLIMVVATALAFISLTGLGAVVMVGTVVLPILIGVGIRRVHAAGILLFGVSLGGIWNVANWGFYQETLHVPQHDILMFATITGACLGLYTLAYVLVYARDVRRTCAEEAAPQPSGAPRLSAWAMCTPLVPVVLLLGFQLSHHELSINFALAVGLFWGILTTRPRELRNLLTASIVEGVRSMAPVIGLMMGIGMAVVALSSDPVKAAMGPALQGLLPSSPVVAALLFGLLSPLALYRGPLNLYGLGAGIGAILATVGLPANLTMGCLMSTGLVQGVCDPTNTQNVWCAQFVDSDINEILKATLPFAWAAAAASAVIIGLLAR